MLLDIVKKGSTDRSVTLRIIDSGDGTPETGVVFNTSGIDMWYRREGAAKTSITEASLSALTDAHADGGFLHVGDGVYRLDLPDAACATGANYVDVGGTVTGMVVIGGRVRLTDFDIETATQPVNVTQFGGSNGTFASGRPEVNSTHWGGTAVASANVLIDGAITANKVATGAIDADALAADAVTEIQSGLATAAALASVDGNVDTLLARITSTLFDGITSLAEWLGLLAGKQTGDSTALTELKATGAGSGTYDPTTDSQEAIRDRGDAAWTTGAGGSAPTVEEIRAEIDSNSTQLAAIVADTNELQTDWANGGRLDLILDARASQTTADAIETDTQDIQSKIGSPANTDLAGDIADVEGKVDDLETRLTATRAGYLDNLSAGAVALETTAQSILTDTAEIGAAGAGLTEAGGTGDHLTALATAAALTTVDSVVDAIKVITDALTAAGAAKLAASALGIVTGTVDTGSFSATTTQFEADDITEATADHYIGRIVTFTSGVLAGQSTDITDYALSGSNGHFTVTALTEAPGNNDTFVIT